MSHEKVSPAAANDGAKNQMLAGAADVSSIADTGESWDEYAAAIDGSFVCIVRTASGRYRRRVWLTLAPAQRAADKAVEAGHSATVYLAALQPLYRLSGGDQS